MTITSAPEPTNDPAAALVQEVLAQAGRRTGPSPAGDSRSEALWTRRSSELVTERRAAHETFQRKIAGIQRELDQAITRVTAKEDALTGMRGQVAVLVRRPTGTPVKVYHSASGTCGRPFHYTNFKEQFESEVKASNPKLRRCTACIWPT